MEIALAEVAASIGAFALLAVICAGAGAAFAEYLGLPGFAQASRLERAGLSLACAFAALPLTLDFAGRLGPKGMTAVALVFAALGAPSLLRPDARAARLHKAWIAGAMVWVVFALTLVVDMPGVGRLGHSLLAVDYVKHAAATWSLAESGSPPWNPTFHEPGRAMSYYYLFYTLPAVVAVLGAPFGLAARHAAYACAPLMGFTLFALAWAVLRRSGAEEAAGGEEKSRQAGYILLALLFATGLDIIPLASLYFAYNRDPDAVFLNFANWDEQVTSWFNSVMWVPHHVAALCAALVGFMSLAAPGRDWRRVLLAALAFASMAGESVYVGATAAVGAVFWLLSLLWRRRAADAAALFAAGGLALAFAAPWLLTLMGRIGADPSPIAFRLRGPEWIDIAAGSAQAGAPYRGLALPFFYLFDFGVFALGALVYWRRAGRRGFSNELGLVLLCLAIASFTVGSFFESTIIFNDLGWRSMLFAQFAALVWTAAAASGGALFRGRAATLANGALVLGYAGTAVAIAQLRFFAPPSLPSATIADEMAAWRWLDQHLPHGAVVQARPGKGRAYGYGLYGRFPAAVADHHNGRLFGASLSEIDARVAALSPLFDDAALSLTETRRHAAQFDIAALVVSSRDPVFATPGAWTAAVRADYANANFRVYVLPGRAP